MIILCGWMANILHTMHKCPRVFLKGESEVASPWISLCEVKVAQNTWTCSQPFLQP